MIVTLSFILLAFLAMAGAVGVLFFRRTLHCAYSFLLCCVALVGLCFLLNLAFLALVQLFTTLMIAGLLAVGTPGSQHNPASLLRPKLRWLPVALILLAIIIWAIIGGRIGEPILQSTPIWAIHGERVAAFGQEMINNRLVLLELVGLFLLASIVSITHLTRQSQKVSSSDELDRFPQQRPLEKTE
ncbi:MAG: hypothetical protein JXA89_24455 [Anaerolineae bacterium]|nr:hypothetical protein [Anaerolineae bacterium]